MSFFSFFRYDAIIKQRTMLFFVLNSNSSWSKQGQGEKKVLWDVLHIALRTGDSDKAKPDFVDGQIAKAEGDWHLISTGQTTIRDEDEEFYWGS